jgi:hypothetical protein
MVGRAWLVVDDDCHCTFASRLMWTVLEHGRAGGRTLG